MKSYHNTTDITGRELDQYESKAKTQEERILEWFTFYEQAATPSRIHRLVLNDAPITSVRRAMTNLTKQGKLEQTPFKRRSPYGRPEYVWQLASPSPQHTLPWRSP